MTDDGRTREVTIGDRVADATPDESEARWRRRGGNDRPQPKLYRRVLVGRVWTDEPWSNPKTKEK